MKERISAVVVSCMVLLAAALSLASCGSGGAVGPPSTRAALTTQAVVAGAPRAPSAVPTTIDVNTMTTSAALGIASSRGLAMVQQLGEAVISYLSGTGDLAAVQALIAPSARDHLVDVLSLLSRPTRCRVEGMAHHGGSNQVHADLLFAGGSTEPAVVAVTLLVDPDKGTVAIAAISPGRVVGAFSPSSAMLSPTLTTILDDRVGSGSSAPVIQIQTQPNLHYLSFVESYFEAEAVVLGKVVEVLALRLNPLAGSGESSVPNEHHPIEHGPIEHQPIVYKGYALEVERAYGPAGIPRRIIIYTLGNGTVVLDGATYAVREEFPLDAELGDEFFIPLVKTAYFGTPELEPDEYWVQANWAVYAVHGAGNCVRVTGAEIDPEIRSEYPLSSLEQAVREQGKEPSVVR